MEEKKTPKRKRRTKAEIEASKETKNETPLYLEHFPEKLVFISCSNKKLFAEINELCYQEKMVIVRLNDNIAKGLLPWEGVEQYKSFISDVENYLAACRQAQSIWDVLKKNFVDEKNIPTFFTETQLVKCSTLSHSEAKSVLKCLNEFGLISYKDNKTYEFVINVDMFTQRIEKTKQIGETCRLLTCQLAAFNALVKNDKKLSAEEKRDEENHIQSFVEAAIEY